MNKQTEDALSLAGEIAGTASRLNVKALQEFIADPANEADYTEVAKAAVDFAKIVQASGYRPK